MKKTIILGIIQGLTEFLPISSSAHLVLVPYLLNWKFPTEQIFPFDVLVQLGTLLAVIIYFWKDLVSIIKGFVKGLIDKEPFKDPQARMGWYLILATIPAGLAGVLIKSKVEAVFSSPTTTALLLFVTAGLLILSDLVGKQTRTLEDITWVDALWIGAFQAISIFPGISRSGSTITGGMTRNLDRSSSARFSFIMSIPVMLGAGLVSLKDLAAVPNLSSFLPILAVGFLAAALVGYLSIHWLLSFIKRQKFWVFAVYCILFASIVLIFGALRTTPVVANSIPTPVVSTTALPTASSQTIIVQYTSALDWFTPAMSTCANALKEIGLVIHAVPTNSLTLDKADVVIRWGEPPQLAQYSAKIATERLVLAVNSGNPLQSLSIDQSRQIFGQTIDTWGALHLTCPDCFLSSYDGSLDNQPIAINLYPEDEDIQVIFNQAIMAGQPAARANALLMPDANAMQETIAADINAIGYLPAHLLKSSIKEVTLNGGDTAALQQPILAISKTEPQGNTLNWLLCLQKVMNP